MFVKLVDAATGRVVADKERSFSPHVNDIVAYGKDRYIVRSREYLMETDTLIIEARRLP